MIVGVPGKPVGDEVAPSGEPKPPATFLHALAEGAACSYPSSTL